MLIPFSINTEMQLPSLYFKRKADNRIGIACEPHPDGIHFRLIHDLYWYSLDELDPVTKEDYDNQIALIKSCKTIEEYRKIIKT
jgi:hypothetical protein